MTTINADVHALWATEAAFPTLSPGDKYKTMAYDDAQKKLMMKDSASDTIAAGWSDDTKQCLLAGAQTLTGDKTITGELSCDDVIVNGNLYLEDDSAFYAVGSSNPVFQVYPSGNITFYGLGTFSAGIHLDNNDKLTLGSDGELYTDGTTLYLKSLINEMVIQSASDLELKTTGGGVLLKDGATSILTAEAAQITLYKATQANDDITLADNKKLSLSSDGDLYSDGIDIQLDFNNTLYLNNGANNVLEIDDDGGYLNVGGSSVFSWGSSTVDSLLDFVIASGNDLKLGVAKTGTSDVAVDGYITILDSSGAIVKLATVA